MQYVFVLDRNRLPLDPCHPARARQLLRKGQASVYRKCPFTIILQSRDVESSITHNHRVKIDPGSRTTGLALIRENDNRLLWAGELSHRGQTIKKNLDDRRAIRRSRRNRKCRYRPPRFKNRKIREGWLPPSLESRVDNIQTWVIRLARLVPLGAASLELVKFDTQAMQNPEICGVEYQQGELMGYEVREYLLEKWGRKCVYCGVVGIPLEIEHIIPKSRGGSNRVSNLALSCRKCNLEKGNQTAEEFGHPEVQALARRPLKDAAAVNATRWELWRRLIALGLPVECGTGGRTKYNRTYLGLPKAHWIDAACVGDVEDLFVPKGLSPLLIQANGHGSRQMCSMNRYGFPRTGPKGTQRIQGFKTGDLVEANVPRGKHVGRHRGRVAVRSSGNFNIRTGNGIVQGVSYKYCRLLQLADGYSYSYQQKGGAASFTC